MKILRVNMGTLNISFEDLPDKWTLVGGRGLTSRIISEEVPPETDSISKEAILVIAGGPLAGTLAPACGRISIGAKSPLTLGIKEANAGGPAAQRLDRLGIRAIVIQGAAEKGRCFQLKINKDGAFLVEADQLKGMGNYAVVEALMKDHGDKKTIISIGPAGEGMKKAATVAFTDKDGHPSRHAARGGLGAVMGSKGLKAIIIDDSGTSAVEIKNKEVFRREIKEWAKVVKEDPQLRRFSEGGTPLGVVMLRSIGSMPSKNYSNESPEGFENLGGEAIAEINVPRGGRMDGCMPGCIVKCSVVFHDKEGKHLTSSFEYETLGLMGTNLGIIDPDAVAEMERMSDDMGIDTIEVGAAMGVAASVGKMEMGNPDSAKALLNEIADGSELGNILADGVVSTCRAFNVKRIPAFRGQAIPAHDPRVCKAGGVTYATSPMGADHTAGLSYEEGTSKEGQVERSFNAQIASAVRDTLGYCMLAAPSDRLVLFPFLTKLLNARYALEIDENNLIEIGKETLRIEIEFNKRAGFYADKNPVPEFLTKEPQGPEGSVFDIAPSEMEHIWDELTA